MTTPKEAKLFAKILWHQRVGDDIVDCINDIADQVERLEAQRKQLRDALSMVRDYVVTMKGKGHDYQITIDEALKATE